MRIHPYSSPKGTLFWLSATLWRISFVSWLQPVLIGLLLFDPLANGIEVKEGDQLTWSSGDRRVRLEFFGLHNGNLPFIGSGSFSDVYSAIQIEPPCESIDRCRFAIKILKEGQSELARYRGNQARDRSPIATIRNHLFTQNSDPKLMPESQIIQADFQPRDSRWARFRGTARPNEKIHFIASPLGLSTVDRIPPLTSTSVGTSTPSAFEHRLEMIYQLMHDLHLATTDLHVLGYAHLDLKPANFIIRGWGAFTEHSYLKGFHFVSLADLDYATPLGTDNPVTAMTFAYVAPEKIRYAQRDETPRSAPRPRLVASKLQDYYSLAVTSAKLVLGISVKEEIVLQQAIESDETLARNELGQLIIPNLIDRIINLNFDPEGLQQARILATTQVEKLIQNPPTQAPLSPRAIQLLRSLQTYMSIGLQVDPESRALLQNFRFKSPHPLTIDRSIEIQSWTDAQASSLRHLIQSQMHCSMAF